MDRTVLWPLAPFTLLSPDFLEGELALGLFLLLGEISFLSGMAPTSPLSLRACPPN